MSRSGARAQRRTDWQLIAIENNEVCNHIAVRHPDGHLVDILGGHPDGLPGVEGTIERDVDESYIHELGADRNWAVPDVEAGNAWVEGVLKRAAGPPDEPSRGFATVRATGEYEVRFEWRGRAYMEVHIREDTRTEQWVAYGPMFIPVEPATGRHRIDFTAEEFHRLVPALASEFDAVRAERCLNEQRS